MGDFFSKLIEQVKSLWSKWTLVQKLILAGIAAASIVAVIVLVSVSAKPGLVRVYGVPVTDERERNAIVMRINAEGVDNVDVSGAGYISVRDSDTARRMRVILEREGLSPKGISPWELFDRERWTITDFERNVNLRRSITDMVTAHIKSLNEIDDANVAIVMPERTLFASDQNPVTASVVITPRPGSDITEPSARKKIEGIQKLLMFAVEGLKAENIVITDHNGNMLNDFAGLAEIDRIARIEKEVKLVRDTEAKYRADILRALQSTFSQDRVRDLNVKIGMDMSDKIVESQKITPIMIKEQTPGLPYDDSVRKESLTLSETTSETTWEGTGFNPEGPAGVEGQMPPAYTDMSNLAGKVSQKTRTHNEEFNHENVTEKRSPTIDKFSVSVNIDGTWDKKRDEKGKVAFLPDGRIERVYTPLPPEDVAKAQALIEGAIGYSPVRGDIVRVQTIQIDRSAQFADEDAALMRQRQMQITIVASLIGIALLMIGFVLFQIIRRAQEAARRRREEQLAREHALMREQALLAAEKEGEDVAMSVEDQARMELQEKAVSMAKEHPADVAQLIRTWILEE